MHKAKNIADIELTAQEVAYEKARIGVSQLELEAATERERMQRLLGTHGETTAWTVTGPLAKVPERAAVPNDLETRSLKASLEMQEAQQRLEGLARKAGFTRTAGWLPDVTLDVHALQGNPEPSSGAIDTSRNWRFGGGARVGLPLFDRRQGTAAALEAEFDANLERYYGMAVDVRSSAREIRARVASSHARAKQYQNVIVPGQKRLLEQTLLQYNAMQIGIYALLQARRDKLEAELAEVETLREYWSAVAELDALMAGKRVSPDAGASDKTMRTGVMNTPTNESGGGH
jgi:outer membrane protein, heavy metal efflux system